jgi:hypothetical protein
MAAAPPATRLGERSTLAGSPELTLASRLGEGLAPERVILGPAEQVLAGSRFWRR